MLMDRLRNKWSDALSNRREFLDAEVRKVMEKRDRTEIDSQRENELIDQWTMLQVKLLVSLDECVGCSFTSIHLPHGMFSSLWCSVGENGCGPT